MTQSPQRLARSGRGTAVRVQANLFERVIRVVKSYANSIGALPRLRAPCPALWLADVPFPLRSVRR